MPCYNAAKFVGESIQSILAQTYTDLELVVVDDCSTDNSKEVVRQFGDPRVRLIELSVKGGRVKSGNLAIRESESEFIARLDADDLMLEDRLARQSAFLAAHPDYAWQEPYLRDMPAGPWTEFHAGEIPVPQP